MTQTTMPPRMTAPHPKTMRAAVLASPGTFDVDEVAVPVPAAGEVRVRIEGCGVCASNIPPFEGREWFRYPMKAGQLGHEAWGVIDAVGADVTRFKRGDRVAFLSECAYAECDVAEQSKVVALPESLADRPFPGEPLGCAINIFRRSNVRAGQTVAIVGVGFLGALLTQLAARAGARVIAIARRPYAQEVAIRSGAAMVIEMDEHAQIIDQVRDLTGGQFCDVVIECVGKQWPLDLAGELTGERGRMVVAGYHQDGPRTCNMQMWNWRGIDVINAHERDVRTYIDGIQAAVEAVSAGTLDPWPLYTHVFPLGGLAEALTMTRDRPDGFMKALIRM
ncbi:MAG: Zn-dependent alcohol dehydrogenase GroES-like protein [Phycisphaerales bacterium]|nr:Zn-dependent alcohol dehydrogenase GroES-like protein [Phycisphaerales bacterium]